MYRKHNSDVYNERQADNGRKPVSMWLDTALIKFIDAKRGDMSRAAFIELFFCQYGADYEKRH